MNYLCAKHAQYYNDYCPYCGPHTVITTASTWKPRVFVNKSETWINDFRKFYDRNDRGGKGRWLVAPWVVREFIKKLLK